METVYFYCAAIGGGILVLQVLLLLIGGDADADTDLAPEIDVSDVSTGADVFLQLSLKTAIAFFTFFGLAGLAALEAELSTTWALTIATGSGCVAFYLVAYLMRLLASLRSDGTLDLHKAIGLPARVYLRIPESLGGVGKITVTLQGRTVTHKAVTAGGEIPTGSEVVIRGIRGAGTFEVSLPPQEK